MLALLMSIPKVLDGFFPYWRIVAIALVAGAAFWGGYTVASNAAAAEKYDLLVKSIELQNEASNRNLMIASRYEETISKLLTDKNKLERTMRNELENPVYSSCAATANGLRIIDDLGRAARSASRVTKTAR